MTKGELFLFILIGTIPGILIHEVFKRYKRLSWIIFWLLPILLTPYWIANASYFSAFAWFKVYSVIGCVWLFLLFRQPLKDNRFIRAIIYGFIAVNLIEAVLFSYSIPRTPKLINSATGFLLILLMPSMQALKTEDDEVSWDVPYFWIVAYSIWNWLFVSLNLNDSLFRITFVLLAPLLVSLWNRKLWLQARASSFAFYLMIAFTFPNIERLTESSQWDSWYTRWGLNCALFTSLLIYSLIHFFKKHSHIDHK